MNRPHPAVVDALRGIAALLVLLSHADAYYLIRVGPISQAKVLIGQAGVDLFFLLSGYLIWKSAERTIDSGVSNYAIHRITRIFPLYIFALAAAIIFSPFFIGDYKPNFSANNIIRHITFTQSLSPSVSRSINPVLWTITHEVIFYSLVPIIWIARRYAWLFFPISFVAAFIAWRVPPEITIRPFLMVAYMFAMGVSIARYDIRLDWRAALAGFTVCVALRNHSVAVLAPAVGFTTMAALWSLPAALRPIIKPFAWLGMISYSLYIWHYLIIEIYGPQVIYNATWLFRIHWLYTSIFLLLVFGFSGLSYLMIERPAMTKLRDWILARASANRASISLS